MKLPINAKGASLIEVLVTLLILSTTLIALASLQTRSLQFNQSAYFRSQANMLAYDILDRIRIYDARGNAGENLSDYNMAATSSLPSATAPLSAADRFQWIRNLGSTLPGATGQIECNNQTRKCLVTIQWQELTGLDGNGSITFSYEARI